MKKSILVVALGSLVLFLFSLGLVWCLPSGKPSQFTIAAGESTSIVASHLAEAKIIRSGSAFRAYLSWTNLDTQLRPGAYDISSATNLSKLANILILGDNSQAERQFTVLEGWSLNEIAEYFAAQQISAKADFFALTGLPGKKLSADRLDRQTNLREKYSFFQNIPTSATLEGFIFPDTYRVYRDASVEEVVDTTLANFQQKYSPDLQQTVAKSGHSFFEIITMASILEREVRGDVDKKIVSDLLWRRIQIGMPLQVDSSVNYVTGGSSASVSYTDLEVDSPYNTYKYPGLPPGPISNPGLESLWAAAQPTPNDYLFFLTDLKGTVYYAKDFEGHKANRIKYLGK